MDINLILGAIAGFLLTSVGRKVLVWLWGKLGEFVKKTETNIDDKIYDASPDFLDAIVDNFDLGTADKILDNFLKDLEEMDEDTSELEGEIKNKKEEIKK